MIKKKLLEFIEQKKEVKPKDQYWKNSMADVLDFLEGLSTEDKKKLAPMIRKLAKEYDFSGPNRKYTFSRLAIVIAGVHCLDMMSFFRAFTNNSFRFREEICGEDYLGRTGIYSCLLLQEDFLAYYCPSWFSDYLNQDATRADSYYSLSIPYDFLIQMMQKGYVKPSVMLSLSSLASYCTSYDSNIEEIVPTLINIGAICLEEHLWYLFEQRPNNEYRNIYHSFEKWEAIFQVLLKEEKIDRKHFLKACLHTVDYDFNKLERGAFCKLFESVKPQKTELLQLQEDLLHTLLSGHSKPITESLKYLKTVIQEETFEVGLFLEKCPILLVSQTKSTVNTTLGLFTTLASKYKERKQEMALLAIEALINQDEKIQAKVVNFLKKNAKIDAQLEEKLNLYAPQLLVGTKALLNDFILLEILMEEEEAVVTDEVSSPLDKNNRFPRCETFEELLFYFSGIFKTKNYAEYELFMGLLLKLNKKVNSNNVQQLAPLIHQASKVRLESMRPLSRNSYVQMFANFIRAVHQRFPKQTENFTQYYEAVDVGHFSSPDEPPVARMMQYCLQNIKEEKTLPLLSTPTFQPCYLDICSFIERLSEYQKEKQAVQLDDFQVALSHLVLDFPTHSLNFAKEKLSGEYLDIVLYMLKEKCLKLEELKTPAYWLLPVLRINKKEDKALFIKAFSNYKPLFESFDLKSWETYTLIEASEDMTIYQSIRLEPKVSTGKELSIFQYMQEHENEEEDKWICTPSLYLFPFLPQLALRRMIGRDLRGLNWSYSYAEEEDNVSEYLYLFAKLWNNPPKEAYLYLACAMQVPKKEIRHQAGALWVKHAISKRMNQELLGQYLGTLIYLEYAPLKRLTDLLNEQMLNLGKAHNQALQSMLEAVIKGMKNKAVRGSKKVLELYRELLSLN